jgi:hypothetical protein
MSKETPATRLVIDSSPGDPLPSWPVRNTSELAVMYGVDTVTVPVTKVAEPFGGEKTFTTSSWPVVGLNVNLFAELLMSVPHLSWKI